LNRTLQDINSIAIGLGYPDSLETTRIGDWYGVIAGRLGFTADRVLIYGKAGAAFVNCDPGIQTAKIGVNYRFGGRSSQKSRRVPIDRNQRVPLTVEATIESARSPETLGEPAVSPNSDDSGQHPPGRQRSAG
jgi:hypothetical protein